MIDMFTINTFAGRAELQCGSESYTHNILVIFLKIEFPDGI